MTEKMTYGILPLYKSFVVKIEVDDEVVKSQYFRLIGCLFRL